MLPSVIQLTSSDCVGAQPLMASDARPPEYVDSHELHCSNGEPESVPMPLGVNPVLPSAMATTHTLCPVRVAYALANGSAGFRPSTMYPVDVVAAESLMRYATCAMGPDTGRFVLTLIAFAVAPVIRSSVPV